MAPHTTKGRDDGLIFKCSCPSGLRHCWHRDNLALDHFRAQWAGATLAALQRRDADLRHWLAQGPDAADEAAVAGRGGQAGVVHRGRRDVSAG